MKGRKVVKTIEDKLDEEVVAHVWTKEESDKLHKEANKEAIVRTFREVAQKNLCFVSGWISAISQF